MSEEAKPMLCDDCGLPIGSGPYYHTGGRISGCHQALMAEVAALRAALDQEKVTNSDLEDVLHRNGFVRCDVAACNCGSWHARYGLRERMNEISDALAEAGHPLDNSNGHIALEALRNLIAERDLFRRETIALSKDAIAMKDALDQGRADIAKLRAFAWEVLGERGAMRDVALKHGLTTGAESLPTPALSGRSTGGEG